jgi:hypothetical protein
MDTSAQQYLFGPLSKKYCDWFYWLSVISFLFMVITILSGIYGLLTHKVKPEFLGLWSASVATYAVFYFQNRLLNTMCLN